MASTKVGIEGMGTLEAQIMKEIWDFTEESRLRGIEYDDIEITVRKVYEAMRKKKSIAYTTIMTVMNNLADKGFLNVDKQNIAYTYWPLFTRTDIAQRLIDSVFKNLNVEGEVKINV